jgi:antitoxin PrlF
MTSHWTGNLDFLEYSEILLYSDIKVLYMPPEDGIDSCCTLPGPSGRYAVEAIVSVDERGQMVLPKELRTRAGISPGDKLAVIGLEKNGKVCCILLIPAAELAGPVKTVVGPLIKGAL